MRVYSIVFISLFSLVFFSVCQSSGSTSSGSTRGSNDNRGMEISAIGAIGWHEAAFSGPMYEGDGGAGIHLAIFAPEIQGDVPGYLPLYIQGLLNNNFKRYSAITIIDRQHLDRVIAEQDIMLSGRFSDRDFVSIGQLTNIRYFLFGTIQRLSGNRYSLQLSITDSETGIRRADFMGSGSLAQLEGSGALINEATADLLGQMGVQLTVAGRQALLAGNPFVVQAEAGLARGIAAQAAGSQIEALFNFTQAVTFDPSQMEALTRLNMLSSTISDGTISERILNDIQARDQWLEVFRDTARFFNDHPPFEIIFDPNLIQIGQTDYARRRVNLGMRIALDPSNAGFTALNTLLEGLEKTGRRNTWGFSGWPLFDITPRTRGTVVFDGRRNFNARIDVALVNERNRTLSNSSITLNTGTLQFTTGNTKILPPDRVEGIVNFQNINADDLTPTMTIVIVAVNGIRSRDLSASGYMRIVAGDLEPLGQLRHNAPTPFLGTRVFSSDGRRVLLSSANNTFTLWDVPTGREIRTFSGHISPVSSMSFSPDDNLIASGSGDSTIKLWDVATGREIRTFSGHIWRINSLSFSPDGRQIVSGSIDRTIKLWDVATGRETRTFSGHTFPVTSVSFSPDGRQIVSGSLDDTIRLWDVATGREISTFSGHTMNITSVSFNPDGRQIVSGSSDMNIKLWDVATGREIRTFSGHTRLVNSVSFSPDGRQIVSGSGDGTIKLWDVVTGREIRTLSGYTGEVHFVSFSPDGRQIISNSIDNRTRNRTTKLWDVATGREIRTFSYTF